MSIATKILTATKYVVPVLAIATVSMAAGAADIKRSPATMCVGQGTPGTAGNSSLSYYPTGALHDISKTYDSNVVCPIVWEDATGSGNIIVTALNYNPSIALQCEAESFYSDDYSIGGKTVNSLGATGNWADVSLGTQTAPVGGYTVIRCKIPRCVGPDACQSGTTWPSGIASFRVQ